MSKIVDVLAREILDSRGMPTIEVELKTEAGFVGRAAVPSGASTGAHEAIELRDQDKKRYNGKGVLKAIENVHQQIRNSVVGLEVTEQEKLDLRMIELDGTENKSKLGANAILGVSLAAARAGALEENIPLYNYVGGDSATHLPVPLINIVNGGAHANNGLDVQEFMIVPVCGGTFKEAIRCGSEVFQSLKKLLNEKGHSTAVGDEGGFAPKLKKNKDALELVALAVENAGYKLGQDVMLALDVAATELYSDGKYTWEGQKITVDQLIETYASWAKEFPIRSIEDGLAEDDWDGWKKITKHFSKDTGGEKIQLVGDDLFVTNPKRIRKGIDEKIANSVLIKVNQIGSLTETWKAVKMAQDAKYTTVMSHRSGETEDTTIADLAVGMNCKQIKTGSVCRAERTAKYNQLMRIEQHLGSRAKFWGAGCW